MEEKKKSLSEFLPYSLLQTMFSKTEWVQHLEEKDYKLTVTGKISLQTQGFSNRFWEGKETKQAAHKTQPTWTVSSLWSLTIPSVLKASHQGFFFFFFCMLFTIAANLQLLCTFQKKKLIYNNVLFVTEDKGEIELFPSIWRWWAAG